tara:strand:- start:1269 stop:2072 length:804 start_codon:yes stop_codon:yes gene_type:complete
MATLTFDGIANGPNGVPSEFIETTNGSWLIINEKLGVDDDIVSSGNAEAVFEAASDGYFETTIQGDGTAGNHGFHLRRTASDDWIALILSTQNWSFRVLKKVNGGSSITLYSDTLTGRVATDPFTLGAQLNGDQIEIFLDGVLQASITESYNQNVTTHALRLDNEFYTHDNVTYPDLVAGLSKSVTFEIPADIQGRSNFNYWVLPASGGSSIANGTLNTSSGTVNIDLSSVSSVTNGQKLYLWGTDEGAAETPYSAWDDALAVVTEV